MSILLLIGGLVAIVVIVTLIQWLRKRAAMNDLEYAFTRAAKADSWEEGMWWLSRYHQLLREQDEEK